MIKIITSGKRKAAIARAVLTDGTGKVFINKSPYETLSPFDRLKIDEPLRIAQQILGELKFNVSISVLGGGEKGQIEAARVALSRAIIKFSKSKELHEIFMDYDRNMLVADVRRKEAYKPGDSKARRNRQTSYR